MNGIREFLFKERGQSLFAVIWLSVVGAVLVVFGLWAPPSLVPREPVGGIDFGRTTRLIFIVGGLGNLAIAVLRFVSIRFRRQLPKGDSPKK